jgi:hypothetical protein
LAAMSAGSTSARWARRTDLRNRGPRARTPGAHRQRTASAHEALTRQRAVGAEGRPAAGRRAPCATRERRACTQSGAVSRWQARLGRARAPRPSRAAVGLGGTADVRGEIAGG